MIEIDEAVLGQVAESAGQLGIELVDVAGAVDEIADRLKNQAALSAEVTKASGDITRHNAAISDAAAKAEVESARTNADMAQQREAVTASLDDISALARDVAAMSEDLGRLRAALAEVQGVTRAILTIANKTDLLALNASIQASHAGPYGKAFGVVAGEVKALARKAGEAAQEIDTKVSHLVEAARHVLDRSQSANTKAASVAQATGSIGAFLEQTGGALDRISHRFSEIATEARGNDARAREALGTLERLSSDVGEASSHLESMRKRTGKLVEIGEGLIARTAMSGVDTIDTTYIKLVQDGAAKLTKGLEAALAEGRITFEGLFDEAYVPIPGTNPTQFMTKYIELTDALFTPVQESVLDADPRVVFCAAVDRNGFLPTHNQKFSKPQGSDPSWNAANSRNRRMFNDRVGLAAGRSTKPFLVQTYRRDMGGGKFALMKDVSAPIKVEGRHWGGLRLAYRI